MNVLTPAARAIPASLGVQKRATLLRVALKISKKEVAGWLKLPLKYCALSRTNKYRPMIDVVMSFILRAKLTKNWEITKFRLPHFL